MYVKTTMSFCPLLRRTRSVHASAIITLGLSVSDCMVSPPCLMRNLVYLCLVSLPSLVGSPDQSLSLMEWYHPLREGRPWLVCSGVTPISAEKPWAVCVWYHPLLEGRHRAACLCLVWVSLPQRRKPPTCLCLVSLPPRRETL